jgi:hypothetical protein
VTPQASSYATPAAFRRALTDRLANLAASSRWTLQQLQRQIAYDRLLERLYVIDDAWIVKGATALLARDIGVRATVDVDIYRNVAREVAETDLRRAAALDLSDWFTFAVRAPTAVSDGTIGSRLPVVASIGTTRWASFHVDLVGTEIVMIGEPDHVPALARVTMPEVSQRGYRAYPLVDHIADKVAAMHERHGLHARPSTRFKDLVDLVAIISKVSVPAESQSRALHSEFARRGIDLPTRIEVPDRALWRRGYPSEAARSLLGTASDLDSALEVIRPFCDPLFAGTAAGLWAPRDAKWSEETLDGAFQ